MATMTRAADIPEAFQAAWNVHDMAALGALFHPDASFVNRFGTYVRGVEAIVDLHRGIHETIYSDSTLQNELLAAEAVAPGVAVVHFWSRLSTGPAHPAGPHQVDTLLQAVMTETDGAWRVKAAENVTLVNPRTGEPVLRP